MNIMDQVQSKDIWRKFSQIPQEHDSTKIPPGGGWEEDALGRSGGGICKHSPDKLLNCARFLPCYPESKLQSSLMLLQGKASPLHKAVSKQGSIC